MEAISVNIVDHALPAPVATKIELSVSELVLNSVFIPINFLEYLNKSFFLLSLA